MAAPVFLITGGSRGIGEAVALSAGRAGYSVLLTYVSKKSAADSVVARVHAAGGQARALQADMGKAPDIERMFAEADKLGRLSALVYNSGITGANSTLLEASDETLASVLDVNLLGAMICAREAVRRMSTPKNGTAVPSSPNEHSSASDMSSPSESGSPGESAVPGKSSSIVFISSRAAVHGGPGEYVWYAASKGAIDSLTVGLAREVAALGIRVNAVSPGVIRTEIHAPGRLESVLKVLPMQRPGETDEVAAAVMFLISDAASYITGANLAVGGGR